MQICHLLRCKLIDKSTTIFDFFKTCQFVTHSVELNGNDQYLFFDVSLSEVIGIFSNENGDGNENVTNLHI